MCRVGMKTAALVACLGLAACNSSTTSPMATPTPQIANISGDYIGTMQDAQGGSGTVTATLAQTGSNAGGTITDKESAATLTAQISLSIATTNAVSGSIVVDYASGTTCTFSTTGTYDPATNILSGSYAAVTNCTGDTGTYSLTQQCTDTVTSHDRRMRVGGIAPC
jgi:hypothetical protein